MGHAIFHSHPPRPSHLPTCQKHFTTPSSVADNCNWWHVLCMLNDWICVWSTCDFFQLCQMYRQQWGQRATHRKYGCKSKRKKNRIGAQVNRAKVDDVNALQGICWCEHVLHSHPYVSCVHHANNVRKHIWKANGHTSSRWNPVKVSFNINPVIYLDHIEWAHMAQSCILRCCIRICSNVSRVQINDFGPQVARTKIESSPWRLSANRWKYLMDLFFTCWPVKVSAGHIYGPGKNKFGQGCIEAILFRYQICIEFT